MFVLEDCNLSIFFIFVIFGTRKSKTKLEKYAEPLLHLSGFLVNIVRTERIDEARDLAKIIDKTNIIAAAGGDGTLFEVGLYFISWNRFLSCHVTK